MLNLLIIVIMAQYCIKELLKERNMTQKELAQKIGISTVSLNRYMTGNPSVSSLEKVAEALNVEISELFVHRKTVETVPAFKCPHCGNKLYIEIKGEDYGEESF